MAQCPFCEGQVDEEVSLYGGTCPHCFGEIPGEEAATDPGEDVRAREEAAIQRRAAVRRSRPVLLAIPLVLLSVALAVYVVLRPEPEPVALNLDDAEFWQQDLEDLMVITATQPAPEEVEVAGDARGAASSGTGEPEVDPTEAIRTARADDAGQGGPRSYAGSADADADAPGQPSTAQASRARTNPFAELAVKVQRKREKGVQLTNDNDIIEMVKSVVGSEAPKLRICYDRRLKQREDLRGAWQLRFTVARSGDVQNPRAVPQDTEDPELEQCIADKLGRWQFQPIKAALPVQRTIRFQPG